MTLKGSAHGPNRLYAHWLDSEWLKIAHRVMVEKPYHTLQDITEGALKLHALFGTRIVISDVQLTDSEVVVRLFANLEFRSFLKSDSSFLTLVAQPRQDVSDPRLAIATRGIHRAYHQKEWTTSLPGMSVDVIRRFADTILSAEQLDTARYVRDRSKGPGRIIAIFPEHKQLLEGILHGICHFVRKTGGPTETPVDSPRAYTNFIEDALNSRGLHPDDYSALDNVWESVKIWVPDESKRFGRSSLIRAMEAKESDRNKWPTEWHRVWNTVVHAWNSNVCDTVGANGSSIVPLPAAVVPFRGKIYDIAGPFTTKEKGILRPRISKRYPLPAFDPSSLSWLTVRDAVRKVHTERTGFQKALAKTNTEEAQETSAKLILSLKDILAPSASTIMPKWLSFPLSVVALIPLLEPLGLIGVLDEGQSLIRSIKRKAVVLNTLSGFQRDLISAFSSELKPYGQ